MHFYSVGKLRPGGHLYMDQQLPGFASEMRNTSVGDDTPLSVAHFLRKDDGASVDQTLKLLGVEHDRPNADS